MKSTASFVGYLAAVSLSIATPLSALADTKTVIESSPEKYSEQRQGDDGTKSELQVDRSNGSKVYKDSDGVTIKEKSEDGKIKQEYQDEDCQRHAQIDKVTGDSKVVSEGNCPD